MEAETLEFQDKYRQLSSVNTKLEQQLIESKNSFERQSQNQSELSAKLSESEGSNAFVLVNSNIAVLLISFPHAS